MADDKKENAIARYWRESSGELKKVSWPTRAEAVQLTFIVIAVMVFMAALLAIVDGIGLRLIDIALGI